MKVFVRGLALCLILVIAPVVHAWASDPIFDDKSDGDMRADGSVRSAAPDAVRTNDRGVADDSKAGRLEMESSMTVGVEMRSGSRSVPGSYGNIGRGVTIDTELYGNTR